jgi:hypothetical protein
MRIAVPKASGEDSIDGVKVDQQENLYVSGKLLEEFES